MSFHSSTNSSSTDLFCVFTRSNSVFYIIENIVNILIIFPICIVILYQGLRLWCQSSSSSSSSPMSHSDVFTYHMLLMELIGVPGYIMSLYAVVWKDKKIFFETFSFFTLNWYGQMLFHLLTCVERYLAVVHPVTYRSLRTEKGIRIRNISIVFVWVLCIGRTLLTKFVWNKSLNISDFCLMMITAAGVSFCSLSVLRVLVRPGPGEQGGNRVDQSKRKALYTMVAILVALFLRFSVDLIWTVLTVPGTHSECVLKGFHMWLSLPSSLVLPLLFLHRHGKLRPF